MYKDLKGLDGAICSTHGISQLEHMWGRENEETVEAQAGSLEGPFPKISLRKFTLYLEDEGKPLKDFFLFFCGQARCPSW